MSAIHPSHLFLLTPGKQRAGSWYIPGGQREPGTIRVPLIIPNQTIRIPEDATTGTVLGRVKILFAPSAITLISAPTWVALRPNRDVELVGPLPDEALGNEFQLLLTATNAKGTSVIGSVLLHILRDPVVVPEDESDWFAPPLSFALGLPI